MSYQFLCDNIDQLDLALDQLAIRDRNFDRFAIMLIDNVVELTLHRFVQDKSSENEMWARIANPKYDPKTIEKGLGRNFDAKAKAARKFNLIDDDLCEAILNLHTFRNTSYHGGNRHEAILHSLAILYFKDACQILKSYKPLFFSSSSSDKIPYRAMKYIGAKKIFGESDHFAEAYSKLEEIASLLDSNLVNDLSADMNSTISTLDSLIEFLATDGPEAKTRNQVVIESQVWPFLFTAEAEEFATRNNCKETTMGGIAKWFADNYRWQTTTDPIPNWRERAYKLSKSEDHHKALKQYCDFMRQTDGIRSAISESASQLDLYIQRQIDAMRGK